MARRSLLRYAAVALIAGIAALFSTALIPEVRQTAGPAEVSIKARVGAGETVLLFPPLGSVSALTHLPPLRIDVSLSRLDLEELAQRLPGDTRRELIDDIESGLRGATVDVGVRQLLGAAVVGFLVAAVMAGRVIRYMVLGAVSGVVMVAAGLAIALATFDLDRFEQAEYTGALEFAPQVMDSVSQTPGAIEDLNSRFATAADRLTQLMALVAQPLPDPHRGTTAILHVSDIHSNPLGVTIARRLARDFDVEAVIDTGDLTSFGQPIESRIGRLLEAFEVPYLFIPGNHDSISNRAQLDRFDNVTLLDKDTHLVDGIEILGWGDPTFTVSNETSTEEGNSEREEEAPVAAAAVERIQPDILATHDERIAADSIGKVPLVLAGHTHEESFEEEDGTLTLTVGSTGATGLGSFLIETDRPYEAQVVYFREGVPVALDYIKLSGLGGDFQIQRRTLDVPE